MYQKFTKSIKDLKNENSNLISVQTDLLIKLEKREEDFDKYKETVKTMLNDKNIENKKTDNKNSITQEKFEQILNDFMQEEQNYKKAMEQLKEENEKMKNLLVQNSINESYLNTSNSSSVGDGFGNNILNKLNKTQRLKSQTDFSCEQIYKPTNKSFNVNNDDTENLLKNQITLLKDELKNSQKELDSLKKDKKNKSDSFQVLRDYFSKFIENIELNNEKKQYLGIIMKGLEFNDKQIQDKLSKGEKKKDNRPLGIFKKK